VSTSGAVIPRRPSHRFGDEAPAQQSTTLIDPRQMPLALVTGRGGVETVVSLRDEDEDGSDGSAHPETARSVVRHAT
jgi:hypothetical protein